MTSKMIEVINIALGCLSGIDSVLLSLKAPRTWDTGLSYLEQDLTWKPLSYSLASRFQKTLYRLPRGRRNQTGPTSCTTYEPQLPEGQDTHKDAVSGTRMSVATNSCLIGLTIHSAGGNSCLVLDT